jgi:hypothetical protein
MKRAAETCHHAKVMLSVSASWMSVAAGIGVIALVLIGAVILMVVVIQAMSRDARSRGSSAGLGNALLEMQTMLEPGKRHVTVAVRHEESEEEGEGDPPEKTPSAD